ncbi:MAG: hypothetical protein ACRDKY_07020 [Solirubrobacteraceae bacterium]
MTRPRRAAMVCLSVVAGVGGATASSAAAADFNPYVAHRVTATSSSGPGELVSAPQFTHVRVKRAR